MAFFYNFKKNTQRIDYYFILFCKSWHQITHYLNSILVNLSPFFSLQTTEIVPKVNQLVKFQFIILIT